VAVKSRDQRERGIKLNGNHNVEKYMQITMRRVGEREGVRRVKNEMADERGIKTTSWYVVPTLPIPTKLRIIYSRKRVSLRWNMHKSIKKDMRTSHKTVKTNLTVHLYF